MKKKVINVETVAKGIVETNASYYSEELLDIIPEQLRKLVVNDDSAATLMREIDRVRFQKEREMAVMLGCGRTRLARVLNSSLNSLPQEQEQKRKEIKFLLNVAATIIHW